MAQFRGIVDKNMDQFRKPGKQVILFPAKLKSGDLISPFRGCPEVGLTAFLDMVRLARVSRTMRPEPWESRLSGVREPGKRRLEEQVKGDLQLFSFDLLLDAVVTGVLLGCFYAAVSLGLSLSFGLLDVPHVAHPAFLVMASYGVFFLNDSFDIDPLLAGLLITPLLFVFGLVAYRLYYETFEKRGSDAGVRGIAFFFGIAFIIEVLLILQFGVDQHSVTASYIGKAWRIGDMRIPFRLLVAFAVAAALTILLTLYLSKLSWDARSARSRRTRRRCG